MDYSSSNLPSALLTWCARIVVTATADFASLTVTNISAGAGTTLETFHSVITLHTCNKWEGKKNFQITSEIGTVVNIKELVFCDAMTYKLVRYFREENEVMLPLLYLSISHLCKNGPFKNPWLQPGCSQPHSNTSKPPHDVIISFAKLTSALQRQAAYSSSMLVTFK